MKIVMSADCFYPAQLGGPSNAIYWQARALTKAGHAVTVVATSQSLPPSVPLDRWLILDCGRVIYTGNPHFYFPIKHIWHGWQAIRSAELVHINSLFYPASLAWVLMSLLLRKPIVWSPHGELSPVALRFRPYLKRLLLMVFRLFRSSICFHATSEAETACIRQHFGAAALIGEIPNRMEVSTPVVRTARPYLLFMGRLHPIKAIDRLLVALSTSRLFRAGDYTLLIAGPDSDKAYTQWLMALAGTLKLSEKVSFIGPVYGDRKAQLYADARLLILPSHSENFGNVVLESLAQGTPVIASTNTPWHLLETERAGRWVDTDPEAIRQAVDQFLIMPSDEYESVRTRALHLARHQFDSMSNVTQWEHFYTKVGQRQGGRDNNKLIMSTKTAVDFHGEIAGQFDRKYESSGAFLERFRVWTSLFEQYIKPTDCVMDLGCGTGIFSNYLAEKGCVVLGIDGSQAMIDRCNQKKTVDNVCYVVTKLPLPDPVSYALQDIILMSSLLEYMDDMTQMLQQVSCLLKPSGLLLVSIPNQLSLYRRVERRIFRLTNRPAYFAHIRNLSTETTFNQQLSELGFDRLGIAYFSSHDPISSVLKSFLAPRYVNSLFVGVYRKRVSSMTRQLPT